MKKIMALILSLLMMMSAMTFAVSAETGAKTYALNLDAVDDTGTTLDCSHVGNTMSTTSYIVLSGRTGYVDYTVNVAEAGKYAISVFSDALTAGVSLSVSVDETMQLENVFLPVVTGAYQSYTNQALGEITLKQGKNVLRIASGSQSSGFNIMKSFTLTSVVEEVWPKTYALNTAATDDTGAALDLTHIMTGSSGTSNLALSGASGYVDYTVYVSQAGKYAMSIVSDAKNENVYLSISVGGTMQLENVHLAVTGDFGIYQTHELGNLTLQQGNNVIRIASGSSSKTANMMKSFTLAPVVEKDYIEPVNGVYTLTGTADCVSNYYLTGASSEGFSSNYFIWRIGSWLEYDIYSEEEQYLEVTLDICAPDTGRPTYDIIVNGEPQIQTKAGDYIPNGWNQWKDHKINGYIHVPAGGSTVRFLLNASSVFFRTVTLAPYSGDTLLMQDFRVETKEGARAPYAVKSGFTGYAKVDMLKLGNPTGEYNLILAQYEKRNGYNALVDASITTINVSTMANKEKRTFTAPLTYKGQGGGWVKALLVDKNTMAPQEKAIMYYENEFFDEAVLEEQTFYTNAQNVKNSAGENYGNYDIHDENYDIEAIFYDSVAGDQTKVFAYIGVPKGATEENPVPAVVCVHGGGGVAFPDWVRLWNDRGYAAIAMTLTGDGPEASPQTGASSANMGKYPHPYSGQTCWGWDAFLADYENAAMYQNVLNVIRAHNVLRQYPGVDENKIGITGISWGGVTTTTTIGVDNRFQFAVPIYGCGYLDECDTYFANYFTSAANTVMWDPANFSARTTVPTLFINGDSDQHFSVNSTSKTVGVTEGSRMSIHHKYAHGYSTGWALEEAYVFADAILEGRDPFITVTSEKAENGTFTATYTAPAGVSAASAELYYIKTKELPFVASGAQNTVEWHKLTNGTISDGTVTFALPEDATFGYVSIKDNNGYIISTKYIAVK